MYTKYLFFSIVSIIGLLIRTIYDISKYKLRIIKDNKLFDFLIIIVMIITWGSWLNMPKNDPVTLNIPGFIKYSGLIIYIIGVTIAIIGGTQIIINIIHNFITKKNNLINYGIYTVIRHPMYYGFIIFIIGLIIYRGSLITLITAPIWISFLISWLLMEQKELEKNLDGYKEYKKTTWF